jgi:hypothetical protein
VELEKEVDEDHKGPHILCSEVEMAFKEMRDKTATGDYHVPVEAHTKLYPNSSCYYYLQSNKQVSLPTSVQHRINFTCCIQHLIKNPHNKPTSSERQLGYSSSPIT